MSAETIIAEQQGQPPIDVKHCFSLGEKVSFACWSKACKAAEGTQVPSKAGKTITMGPKREFVIEAFKATQNKKSAFAIGKCPVCSGKISRIVTIASEAAAQPQQDAAPIPAAGQQ